MTTYTLNWVAKLTDGISAPAKSLTQAVAGVETNISKAGTAVSSLGDRLFKLNQVVTAISGVEAALQGIIEPGAAFDQQLKSLSSITGVTGSNLDALGVQARSLSKEFGGSAADNIEAMKLVISKLGPEVANNSEAFAAMNRNVQVLSKASGLDAPQAVDALSTSLLQFNVNLKDPLQSVSEMARMTDIMSAASVAGSAEIPQIAEALKNSGNAAYNAGVSFKETNAIIQVLGKSSLYGAEAGTSLRNILLIMGKGRFMEKDAAEGLEAAGVSLGKIGDAAVPFKERLLEIAKISKDSALVAKVFGSENANAALGILSNVDAYDEYLSKLDESGVATAQAATNMSGFQEIMARMKARMQDVGISIFEATKPVLPFVLGASQVATGVASLLPITELFSKGFGKAAKAVEEAAPAVTATSTAMKGLNLTMLANPFVIAAAAIVATGVALYLFYQNSETVREAIDKAFAGIKRLGTVIWDYLAPVLKWLGTLLIEVGKYLFDIVASEIVKYFDKLALVAETVATFLQDLYNRIVALVNSPFATWLQGIIQSLNAWWQSLSIGVQSVSSEMSASFSWISDVFNWVTSIYDAAVAKIEALTSKIKGYLQPVMAFFGQDAASVNNASWGLYDSVKQVANVGTNSAGTNPPTKTASTPSTPPALKVASPLANKKSAEATTMTGDKTSAQKNIAITIKNLVENINITAQGVEAGADEIRRIVTETLVRAVSDAEIIASSN